jgi:hypothetical protein
MYHFSLLDVAPYDDLLLIKGRDFRVLRNRHKSLLQTSNF